MLTQIPMLLNAEMTVTVSEGFPRLVKWEILARMGMASIAPGFSNYFGALAVQLVALTCS